ncbi:MAG: hypothetical protein M5F18_00360 [Asgard group archaeon]|nr:hypothetical protein [Asgard group archaeon]
MMSVSKNVNLGENVTKQSNTNLKEPSKPPMQITFAPIIGHDPSHDMKKVQKANKSGVIHRFPTNVQVMYKPKK